MILSRDGNAWIREENVEDTALPLYEGRMIGQFDFSQKGWVSGKGRGAVWREIPWEDKQIEPQFLMCATDYELETPSPWSPKLTHMNVGSATNMRSAIGSFIDGMPAGHSAPTFHLSEVDRCLTLTAVFNAITFDFITRLRVTGLHLDYHVLEQNPLPRLSDSAASEIVLMARKLCLTAPWFAPRSLELQRDETERLALAGAERLRLWATLDALIAASFGLDFDEFSQILKDCDCPVPTARAGLDPKGFWRIDKDKAPELRHTVLTLVAFQDLEAKVRIAEGDRDLGIEAFLSQNDGDGWILPEALCLTDYGLGRDDRARRPQVVAPQLGPRFYDWQLAQCADETVRECHLHARNVLGADGYARLLVGLIKDSPVAGKDGLGLLADRTTQGLLGPTGYLVSLLEVHSQGIMEESDYWAGINALHANGYLDQHLYDQLLGAIYGLKTGDEANDVQRLGGKLGPPRAAVQSKVAERAVIYKVDSPTGPQQPELFDSC